MVLHTAKINAICLNGEAIYPESLMKIIAQYDRNKVLLLYDNDKPGIKASLRYAFTYNIPIAFIDKAIGKDCADVITKLGVVKGRDYLRKLIHANLNVTQWD